MMLKSMVKLMVGLLVIGMTAGTALAQNRAGALTLSPMVGGYMYEGDQNFKDDTTSTFGLGVGYNLTKNWGVEALVNYIDKLHRQERS